MIRIEENKRLEDDRLQGKGKAPITHNIAMSTAPIGFN